MSTDYILQKLDALTGELQQEREARRELQERLKKLVQFTGYDTWQDMPGGRKHGDLAGHQVGLIGRVRHLERQTGIEYEALPEEVKEELEGSLV